MKAIHMLTGALGVIVLSATVATAQETPQQAPRVRARIHEPGTGLRGDVVPQRRHLAARDGRGFATPGRLLAGREFLSLTDDQVATLEELDRNLVAQREQSREALRVQQEELRELWSADQPDADAIRVKTEAVLNARTELAVAQADASARAKGILSAEQLGKLEGFRQGYRRGMGAGSRSAPHRSRTEGRPMQRRWE